LGCLRIPGPYSSWNHSRTVFTLNALHASLREQGYEITVTELGDKLILAADFFKGTSTRVQFLSLIRKSNADLCKLGFRAVNLSGSGLFASGENYSLNCK
jgi:hypothetical protein